MVFVTANPSYDRKKGFISPYCSISQFITEGSKGRNPHDRNLEAEVDAEAMEEPTYWLVPCGLLNLLSYL